MPAVADIRVANNNNNNVKLQPFFGFPLMGWCKQGHDIVKTFCHKLYFG
jgi:hypothetical protein